MVPKQRLTVSIASPALRPTRMGIDVDPSGWCTAPPHPTLAEMMGKLGTFKMMSFEVQADARIATPTLSLIHI